MSDRMAGLLDIAARFLQGDNKPNRMMAGAHPGDAADLSAMQLAPHMAKGLINDVAKYGSQTITGKVSDGDFLQQQPLTGQAKTIADAVGSGLGKALNYQVPSLMRGSRSIMDDISVVADGYRKVKPSLVNAFGESNVNRGEGAGLLGSMFIPAKIPKAQSGGLFSQAVIASDKLQRKTGNADGFFNDLTGKGQVKPDELNAMGFKENFAGRQDVSRQEVQQFVGDNQLQIKETVLGRKNDKPYGLYDDDDMLVEAFATKAEADAALDAVPQEVFDRGVYYRSGEIGGLDTSQFGSYTLEGGDNYREILLQDGSRIAGREQLRADIKDANDHVGTLKHVSRIDPSTDYADELRQAVNHRDGLLTQLDNAPSQYVNPNHFEQPDVLAHLRMKDRVDADGNKTLLIEEAQSDWHQTGGDRGYVNNAEYEDLKSEQRRLNVILDDTSLEAGFNWGTLNAPDLSSAVENARTSFRIARQKAEDFPLLDHSEAIGTTRDNLRAAKIELDDAFQEDYLKQNGVRPGAAHEQAQSEMQMLRAELDPMHDAVPDAPFKTDDKSSWYNLAMKRGLLEAVEGGYDKLALTTGRQQADRYDLSKQINEVRLGGDEQNGFTVSAFDKNDSPVIMQSIDSLDALPNLIGKDAAKSLVDQPLTDTTSGSARILAGQDLSIGGEGMKQFYDRTLPNTLGKLVKQDGVKVGKSELPRDSFEQDNALLGELGLGKARASDTVHSIDITPKMRERVKKGLPLFATGGAAIGLAEMMSQQPQEDQRPGLFNSLQY